MRRDRLLVVPFVMLLCAAVCFGQMKNMGPEKMDMQEKSMMMDSSQCCMMDMQAMCMMMPRYIVATGDGGLVVLSGNRLLQYDKELNFKKAVVIEKDSLAMRSMMMRMSNCPMMKQMHKGMKMSEDQGVKNAGAGYWTCSMHPEINKAEPGNCPLCGMKLEFKKSKKDSAKIKK